MKVLDHPLLRPQKAAGAATPAQQAEQPSSSPASSTASTGGGIGTSLKAALRARSGVVAADQGIFEPVERGPLRTKQLILIRHGRSTWNEFLGQHKQRQCEEKEQKNKGLRGALRNIVRGPRRSADPADSPDSGSAHAVTLGPEPLEQDGDSGSVGRGGATSSSAGAKADKGTFWQGVRGGVRKVGNAIGHVKAFANQVDHPLSPGGLAQARALREAVQALAQDRPLPADGGGAALARCRSWYVSPFLRALQTAAYALEALHRRDPTITMKVIPEAREIVKSPLSLDCQGKKGNVGVKVVARALAKTAEAVDENEGEDPCDPQKTANRQAELAGMSSVLCGLDLQEVAQEWWVDVKQFKKEDLRRDDDRIRRLVQRLLRDPDPQVGVVGHSLIFQRMIQLFLSREPGTQAEIKTAMRNGAPETTKDPLNDKIMNCGTLVLTWRYRESEEGIPDIKTAEIHGAEFLFDGHMESAGPSEDLGVDPADLEDLGDFLMDVEEMEI